MRSQPRQVHRAQPQLQRRAVQERIQRGRHVEQRLQKRENRIDRRALEQRERALRDARRGRGGDKAAARRLQDDRKARAQERRQQVQERIKKREQRAEERAKRREQRAQELGKQRERRALRRDAERARGDERRALRNDQDRRRDSERRARIDRVKPDDAARGRFAGRFHDKDGDWRRRVDDRKGSHFSGRHAWRRGHRAKFVAWFGPIFWPYAYFDIFHYTFWPYAYDEAYWPYAYDDIFESVYFPYGSGHAGDGYIGPYTGGYASVTPGGAGRPRTRSETRAIAQVCEPDKGVTAWPFERITRAVQPDEQQRALLADLKDAAADAAADFKAACPRTVAMTPVGRLEAMIERLDATLDAVRTVRPPLEAFYASLSDEQKARFNALGPNVGKNEQPNAQSREEARCGGAKPGLSSLPIERIDEVVRPSGDQESAFTALREANDKAVERLEAACPDFIPQTPVGRLEAMENRLVAMLDAAKTVQPALDDFYASLDSEQKARFNTLGRDEPTRAER
jgi:hypothetical protein